MAGAIDMMAGGAGGGGGSLQPLIAALDHYTSMLQTIGNAINGIKPVAPTTDPKTPAAPAAVPVGVKPAIPAAAAPVPVPTGGLGALMESIGGLGKSFTALALQARLMAEVARAVAVAVAPLDAVFKAIGDMLEPIANAVAGLLKLAIAISPIMVALKLLSKLLTIVLMPFKMLGKIVDAISSVLEAFMIPLDMVAEQMEAVADAIAAAIAVIGISAKSAKTPQNAVNNAFKSATKTIENVLVNPLEAIPGLIGQIRGAVETLNPAAMVAFDLAMRDLMAVFGEAFMPIVQVATNVVREFANTLRPILQTMAPLFKRMSESIGALLIKNIDRLTQAFERMLPFIEMYIKSMIDAATRQGAIADQSAANNSSLKDIGSFFANFFRSTKQIEDSAKKERAAKDKVNNLINIEAVGMNKAVEQRLLGIIPDPKVMKGKLQNKIDEITKLEEADKKAGFKEPVAVMQGRSAEKEMLKNMIDLSQMRDQFVKSGAKDQDGTVKGGEQALNETLTEVHKARKDLKEKKIDQNQFNAVLNRLVEAQKFLGDNMKNAIKAGKPAGAEGLAAAVNPAFKSIADLTRETLLSAFVATSTGADMKEKQNQKAVDNVAALPEVIKNGVQEAMVAALKQNAAQPEQNAARPVFAGGMA